MQFVGLVFAIVFLGVMLFNGLTMLFSPARWFRLPRYIGFQGSLSRDRLSTISGRLGIRVLGLVFVTATLSMIAGFFEAPRRAAAVARSTGISIPPIYMIACLAVCIASGPMGYCC
jgi:hypothetical protein